MTTPVQLRTVFGFLNRSQDSLPAPLVTVATIEGSDGVPDAVVAIYPNGDEVRMIDEESKRPLTIEDISLRPSFIPVSTAKSSSDPRALTSFGFAANHISVGTAQKILKDIELAITCDQYPEDLEILTTAQKSWEDYLTGAKPAP